MAASQGYKARVYMTGTSTSMTDEPMTQSGATKTYYTTDADKNIWDPTQTFVIKDNAVTVATSNYELNYLLGKVTFDAGYSVTGPVTVTGNYLPYFEISTCRSFSLNLTVQDLDSTTLGDEAMSRLMGLIDATGTVERFDIGEDDYDTVGTSGVTVFDALSSRSAKVIEIDPTTDSGTVFRVMTRFQADEVAAEVDGLQTGGLSFQGTLVGALTRSVEFGDPTA